MNGAKYYCGECHKVISVENRRKHNKSKCIPRSVAQRRKGE